MANDLNRCEFIGNLGKDVELRYTPGGDPIANFTLACNESWTKNGQKQEKTTWVPVVVFGKLADVCSKYLSKGSKVYVAGKFSVRKWQDQSGNDRYSTEVVIDQFNGQMQMLGGKTEHQGYQQPQQAAPKTPPGMPQNYQGGVQQPEPDLSEDIPF